MKKKYCYNLVVVNNYKEPNIEMDLYEWIEKNFKHAWFHNLYGTQDEIKAFAELICNKNDTFFIEKV